MKKSGSRDDSTVSTFTYWASQRTTAFCISFLLPTKKKKRSRIKNENIFGFGSRKYLLHSINDESDNIFCIRFSLEYDEC